MPCIRRAYVATNWLILTSFDNICRNLRFDTHWILTLYEFIDCRLTDFSLLPQHIGGEILCCIWVINLNANDRGPCTTVTVFSARFPQSDKQGL